MYLRLDGLEMEVRVIHPGRPKTWDEPASPPEWEIVWALRDGMVINPGDVPTTLDPQITQMVADELTDR